MRTVRILSVVVGGIIALIVAGMFAVWLSVNPNDYKGQIAAAVKQSTGRELSLKGDIKLSVFPWVALELGPASLGNPPGFGEEAFLAFNHAAVRVKLFPLLAKRLDVGRDRGADGGSAPPAARYLGIVPRPPAFPQHLI